MLGERVRGLDLASTPRGIPSEERSRGADAMPRGSCQRHVVSDLLLDHVDPSRLIEYDRTPDREELERPADRAAWCVEGAGAARIPRQHGLQLLQVRQRF